MKTNIIKVVISLILCFFVYPSAFIYPYDTLPDSNDTRLISYIVGQVQENILERKPLHSAHFFAPEVNTLAYSDLFLVTSVTTLPFRVFTNSPIFIFNIGFILSFVLTCIFAYNLFEYLFKNNYTSFLLTLVFTLSGYHLHYYAHLQIFSLWLTFAALINLQKFINLSNYKYFIYFLIFFCLQFSESIFTAYLLFFASIFTLFPFLLRSKLTILKKIILLTLPFLPVLFLLVLPYAKLHFSVPEATRSIRDAANFSLGVDQVFNTYNSWTFIVLFIASFLIYNTSPSPTIYLFIFSIIMTLGPVLKIFGTNLRLLNWPIPLPYTFFYYLFPGFTGFRTPSRFIVLALLAACLLMGNKLNKLFSYLNFKTKLIFIAIIFCLLTIEAKLPLTGYPVNINAHPVYKQVKNLPNSAIILELPIKLWNSPDHEIESIRSLYSLEHKHSRFGGFSGFATNNWIKLVEEINAYSLTPETIQKLKTLGITHIIENNTILLL